MRNISDTIARLSAMRAGQGLRRQQDHDTLSDLAAFGSDPGALRARSYVPENLPQGAPLVVVLHGCRQDAAAYDHGSGWSQLAAEQGFAILFPEQRRANNPNLCFNWFVPDDVNRDRGEVLSIRQMIETLVTKYGLDRRRVFITGLSAGGAMAAAMLATYPDVFAAGAIIAGLAYGCASTIPEAFDRMRGHGGPSPAELQRRLAKASPHKGPWPRISVWQGTADHTVVQSNADSVVAQWQGVHRVPASSARKETVDGQTRQVWCGPDGNEVIEKYTIAGMGHGTPLQTSGSDGLGRAGPFMQDVGISSTRHIARFWGLTEPKVRGEAEAAETASGAVLQPFVRQRQPSVVRTDRAPEPRSGNGPGGGITKVIEDALRAAGLMR